MLLELVDRDGFISHDAKVRCLRGEFKNGVITGDMKRGCLGVRKGNRVTRLTNPVCGIETIYRDQSKEVEDDDKKEGVRLVWDINFISHELFLFFYCGLY